MGIRNKVFPVVLAFATICGMAFASPSLGIEKPITVSLVPGGGLAFSLDIHNAARYRRSCITVASSSPDKTLAWRRK